MRNNISRKKQKQKANANFKRKWGVTPKVFKKMVSVIDEWNGEQKDTRGRKSALTTVQQVQVTLMYWREYRTMFHIAEGYGVAESTICRVIQRIEDILIQSGKFNINGGKANLMNNRDDNIVIDVMECEIERPKKNKRNTILVKRKSTR